MKKSNKFLLVVSLILCAISMIFSSLIQTNFGKVTIENITVETEYGNLTGYLLKPKNVSKDNKAPAVICNHGYLNNREMQDEVYVELSRRGYVVISMDSYGHGDSAVASEDADPNSPLIRSNGMIAFVEYASKLDYVDTTQIGVTGHSMGGQYSAYTMYYYSQQPTNLINTGVIVGNYPNILFDKDGNASEYDCNAAVILAQYDEFFYDHGVGLLSNEDTLKLVEKYTGQQVASAEEGKAYTNASGKSIMFYNPAQFHATNHFSIEVTGLITSVFEKYMPTNTDLTPDNQVWWIKEGFNLLGLLGFFMIIIPILDLLMQIPIFKKLKKEVRYFDKPEKKGYWYKKNFLSGVYQFLLTLPALLVGYLLLQNKLFPQDTTGGVAIWCVVCGLFSISLQKKLFGKKIRKNKEEYGIKTNIFKFIKTFILALLVVAITYIPLFIASLLKTDFRIWTFDIRKFSVGKALVALRYLPFFAFFYVISGFAICRATFKKWSQFKQCLVMATFSIIAPALFLFVCYFPTTFMHKIVWAGLPGVGAGLALMAVIMIPFVPILAISAIISVKSYRLTGNMWIGGLINAILITMITVANTSFSIMYLMI